MEPQTDGIRNGEGKSPLTPSEQEAARLKALFQGVEPLEITGLDLTGKTPQEIARLLPRFTTLQLQGENPACGILVDVMTGKKYAILSGWSPHKTATWNGITFKRGTLTQALADLAGLPWDRLGAHVEGQAAAFMRRAGITEAILYLNAVNPCKGRSNDGCLFRLNTLLEESARLTVFNKHGRPSYFKGDPDQPVEVIS